MKCRGRAMWSTAVVVAVVLAGPACRHAAPPGPAPDTVGAAAAAAPGWQLDWARNAVFYEIFVRSFADSDGDGIGDLAGLTAKLDYLNDGDPATDDDLGVDALWLMPIFPSPSYHGYDVVDYRDVNPDYGDLADLRILLDQAHRRGIRVIVDLVVNHTSADHPWFVESASSRDNPKRNWYVWREDDPGWTQPWSDDGYPVWHPTDSGYYYGIFWSGMPDLNLANPEVREQVFAIADYWLDLGIDGFRLDAARHLFANGDGELQNDQPETHAFWRAFSAHVRTVAPDALLVGENWTSLEGVATYFGTTDLVPGGDELPMSFDFQLAGSILDATRERTSAPVLATLAELAAAYPPGVLDGTFLTNHDMPRVATQLGGDPAMLRTAAALLLTLPGVPFLYYGEEIGMTGDKPDPDIRTPMQWSSGPGAGFTTGTPWRPPNADSEIRNVALQDNDPGSLLSWYRRLVHLRESQPALARGDFEPLDVPDTMVGFARRLGDRRVIVLHNLGLEPAATGPLALDPADPILLSSAGDGLKVGGVPDATLVVLPPGATVVFDAR